MRKGSFGRRVCQHAATWTFHSAGDGRNIDNARRVAFLYSVTLLQEWQQGHGYEELARDVGLESLGPVGLLGLHEVVGDGTGVCHVEIWVSC